MTNLYFFFLSETQNTWGLWVTYKNKFKGVWVRSDEPKGDPKSLAYVLLNVWVPPQDNGLHTVVLWSWSRKLTYEYIKIRVHDEHALYANCEDCTWAWNDNNEYNYWETCFNHENCAIIFIIDGLQLKFTRYDDEII